MERHVLEIDPFNTKPSAQLKVTTFGKVVFPPNSEPFLGISRGPQSFAVQINRKNSSETIDLFPSHTLDCYKKELQIVSLTEIVGENDGTVILCFPKSA